MKAFSVFGSPGCGKTTEVIRRLDAIKKAGADPMSLAFMSFTKAAATEAMSRVGLDNSSNFSTIHSLCYRLTKVTRGAVVDWQKLKALSEQTNVPITCKGADEDGLADGDHYLQVIGYATNTGVSNEEAYERSDRPGTFGEFISFARTYKQWKEAYCYVDFNDMLARMLGSGIKYQMDYIFVDEAQDLTPLQWKVIDKLVHLANPKEVHISGDDDQLLYEWSGAASTGMSDFEDRYHASRHVLPQSWRIPRSVHRIANAIIARVQRRVPKEYRPRGEEGVVEYLSDEMSADAIHGEDTLILGRTHASLKDMETELIRTNVPYSKSGRPGLFNNKYAAAIRTWGLIFDGKDINDYDYKHLRSCLWDKNTKAEFDEGNFRVILDGEKWYDSLNIPYDWLTYYKSVNIWDTPTVRLSTIHGAKGGEADRVILLTDLTDRIRQSMIEYPDGEHRCFYVGVTRAKHKLNIIDKGDGYGI